MKELHVSSEIIQEGKNIIDGFYAPLEGFLSKWDLDSVLDNMRLFDGAIWPMPILLDVDKSDLENMSDEAIVLTDGLNRIVMYDHETYKYDKEALSKKLFGTTDKNHPGVSHIAKMKEFFLGGKIKTIDEEKNKTNHLYHTASETREIFKKNKWRTVAAFQTRNPPHRSHEHLQKKALGQTDGLLINPIIGPKKIGDFHDKHIIGAYNELIKHYFHEKSVVFTTFHTFMRYAGPKEAVFHALVRKNLGCTHMIIGRDHAGVGEYYDSYDAHNIFDCFDTGELGIEILRYKNVHFCGKCMLMREDGECVHEKGQLHLSGTDLRNKLMKNESISEKFVRKEVLAYLLKNRNELFL